MSTTHFGLKFSDLCELEYISQGNQLPNQKEFLKKYANEFSLECFKNTYIERYGMSENFDSFEHELGTLLLNAKTYANGGMFGMKYGHLCAVTYVNNSISNLLEFYLTD